MVYEAYAVCTYCQRKGIDKWQTIKCIKRNHDGNSKDTRYGCNTPGCGAKWEKLALDQGFDIHAPIHKGKPKGGQSGRKSNQSNRSWADKPHHNKWLDANSWVGNSGRSPVTDESDIPKGLKFFNWFTEMQKRHLIDVDEELDVAKQRFHEYEAENEAAANKPKSQFELVSERCKVAALAKRARERGAQQVLKFEKLGRELQEAKETLAATLNTANAHDKRVSEIENELAELARHGEPKKPGVEAKVAEIPCMAFDPDFVRVSYGSLLSEERRRKMSPEQIQKTEAKIAAKMEEEAAKAVLQHQTMSKQQAQIRDEVQATYDALDKEIEEIIPPTKEEQVPQPDVNKVTPEIKKAEDIQTDSDNMETDDKSGEPRKRDDEDSGKESGASGSEAVKPKPKKAKGETPKVDPLVGADARFQKLMEEGLGELDNISANK